MRIHRLHLVNFRQHADTELELGEGLTGIVGPNGAGKTTLLEAIAWAMYGTPAARGNKETIRRRGSPPQARVEVEVEFSLGAHRYRLQRTLGGAELYQDGGPAPVANSLTAVTERVTRLLGMTRDEFFNTYFTGQKELAIMAALSAPERAQFLSRVLGYERLRTVQVTLKEERSALKAALQSAENTLADPAVLAREEEAADARLARVREAVERQGRALADAAAVYVEVLPRWEAMQRLQEEGRSLESDLRVAEHQAVEAKRAFGSLDRELAEALGAKARLDEMQPALAGWEELVRLRDRLDGEAQAFAGRRAIEGQLVEVRGSLAALEQRLASLPDGDRLSAERGQLAELQSQAARLAPEIDAKHTAWVRDRQDAETQRKNLLAQYEELREQRRRLLGAGPEGDCPTCGRPLGGEYPSVLDLLSGQIEEVKLHGNYYKQRIDQLAQAPADLAELRQQHERLEAEASSRSAAVARLEQAAGERARLEQERDARARRAAELEAGLAGTPTAYDQAAHRQARERLAALTPLRDQATRLAAQAERAVRLVPLAAEAEQTLSRAEARVEELKGRLVALGSSPQAFEAARAAYAAAERRRQTAEVERARGEAELIAAEEHRAAVARRRAERERAAAEVGGLKDELLLNQELDRAFTDLRSDLNATIRPDLSQMASELLRDLTTGRYTDLELDPDYQPTIHEDGEPKPVISGGEEDLANLALRLAISQMIAERAGQPFSLLILDEIFGSLDEERRTAVVDLLRNLADRFPQVILITHIESVNEGFDRVIRIAFDVGSGVATAREEGPPLPDTFAGEVPVAAA